MQIKKRAEIAYHDIETEDGKEIIATVWDSPIAEYFATLFAAAPDLLEALENAEFLLRNLAINPDAAPRMTDSVYNAANIANAAIAKAKGE